MSKIKELSDKYSKKVENLFKLAGDIQDDKLLQEFDFVKARLHSASFKIIVVGEFNRGKSTFINALLGMDILPTAEQETTATINILRFSSSPYLEIKYKDGHMERKELSTDELSRFDALTDFDKSQVENIVIGLNAPILEDGTEIIDTPGVNDPNEHRMEVTYGFIPYSDATIFLLDATQPFTASESDFLTGHILGKTVNSIIFVLNRIDQVPDSSIDRLVENVKQKIIGTGVNISPTVIPLSAQLVIDGLKRGEQSLVDSSFIQLAFDTIDDKLSEGRRLEIKNRLFEGLFKSLASKVSGFLKTEIDLLESSKSELLQRKNNLLNAPGLMDEKFKEIQVYLEEDKHALLRKIGDSLRKKKEVVLESLIQEIKLQQKDLNQFCEQQLPYKLKQHLTAWIERNEEHISGFLRFSFNNAASHFEKSFRAKINPYNKTNSGLSTHMTDANPNLTLSSNLEDIEKISFGVGAFAAFAFSIFTGGLGLIMLPTIAGSGFLFKNLVGFTYGKKLIENQKTQVISNLPPKIDELFDRLTESLTTSVNEFYENLNEYLRIEYRERLVKIGAQLESMIKKHDTEFADNKKIIDQQKDRLIKINLLIAE